jgi:D-xylose transport system permease protein
VANVAGAQVSGETPAPPPGRTSIRELFAQTEIDLRLFGMLVAFAAILGVFHWMSGGKLIQPVNMVTMATQATGIAIIATGMVLVIVTRNIDLSVGSVVGIVSMSYALWMSDWFPRIFGFGPDVPFQWVLAIALGIGLGAAIGALQGFIIAYIGVPSFVVTLGGLLSLRGLVWFQSRGAAVTQLDPTFQLLGGGGDGQVGETITWALGIAGCLAVVGLLYNSRRQRLRYGFPTRPMWAEVLLSVIGCAMVLGLSWFANNSFRSDGVPAGFPFPIVLLVGVTLAMTWLATRRRFGRYAYAYGGNPDAAELAGINTRWLIFKTYVLMGILCAIAAAIPTARLNASTLDIGSGYELYVIAAAVIGGTQFAGGIGTIPGAVLGAFVMQAIIYGLSFNNVNSSGQNVVAGVILVAVVAFDMLNRRRGGGS